MAQLIAVVGASGVGKTALVRALANAYPFQAAYEEHLERPFQALFKNTARYALANQIDYFLFRARQEKTLRLGPEMGLIDGGLDLDFHCFTSLFHRRGLLTDPELDLCRDTYSFLRELLPRPELFIHLCADQGTISNRLAARERISLATAQDTALFSSFLEEWLATIPFEQVLALDVSNDTLGYERSVPIVLERVLTKRSRSAQT